MKIKSIHQLRERAKELDDFHYGHVFGFNRERNSESKSTIIQIDEVTFRMSKQHPVLRQMVEEEEFNYWSQRAVKGYNGKPRYGVCDVVFKNESEALAFKIRYL